MPTITKKRSNGKRSVPEYALYAPLGAGQLLVEKTREVSQRAWVFARKRRTKIRASYEDLAMRGERLVTSVRRSASTRRAIDQARTARSQVKAAATSVRRSAGATTQATKAAAKKLG